MESSLLAPLPSRGKSAELALSEEQLQELEKLTHSRRRCEADRARIMLRLNRGENSLQVSQALGCHPVTIRRVKSQFLKQGLASLPSGKHTGRIPRKRKIVQECLEHLEVCGKLQSPQGEPLSAREIAEQVKTRHDQSVSLKTVRAALKKGAIGGDGLGIVSVASATPANSSG